MISLDFIFSTLAYIFVVILLSLFFIRSIEMLENKFINLNNLADLETCAFLIDNSRVYFVRWSFSKWFHCRYFKDNYISHPKHNYVFARVFSRIIPSSDSNISFKIEPRKYYE
ncbi:MAG: hypothetical protein N3D73_01545 [Candidatus Diapherotrites archaeon]|nr:hypothetical protein [Candidatus Diapherotrites archaeon]